MIHYLFRTPDGVMLLIVICSVVGFFIGRTHRRYKKSLKHRTPHRKLDGFHPADKKKDF
jgi:hypothetical protein